LKKATHSYSFLLIFTHCYSLLLILWLCGSKNQSWK